MARSRVKLIIAGEEHILVSDEPMGYVAQLGQDIDESVQRLMHGTASLPLHKAAILTAITEHDRALKAEAAADNLRDQLRSYLQENNALHTELERLRRG